VASNPERQDGLTGSRICVLRVPGDFDLQKIQLSRYSAKNRGTMGSELGYQQAVHLL
jgi:hypothetical protein